MHEVLVNRLGGLSLPRKSVVRLTDRPDMTLDVYRGRKTTMQHSICRSHTPDGKQDTCIRKFSKLSIMLTSPAVPYALTAVKIEPFAISAGN